jgi:hypothetical protein
MNDDTFNAASLPPALGPERPKILLLSDRDIQELPGILTCPWNGAIPNLYDFNLVIVSAPREAGVGTEIIPEFAFARDAGTAVAVLLESGADPSFLKMALGLDLVPLRQSGEACTVTDERFGTYFAQGIIYSFFLKPAESSITLAYVRQPNLAIATVDPPLEPKAPLIGLPPPKERTFNSFAALVEACTRLAGDSSPAQQSLRDLRKFAALLLIIVLFLTFARNGQRAINQQLEQPQHSWILDGPRPEDLPGPVLAALHNETPESLAPLFLGDVSERADLCDMLRLLSLLGLYDREKYVLAPAFAPNVLSSVSTDFAKCAQRFLLADARAYLASNLPELARFRAQLYLNLLDQVPAGSYYKRSIFYSNEAHRLLDVASDRNFLYDDQEISRILSTREGDRIGATDFGDPSLADNIAYHDLAIQLSTAGPRVERIQVWENFVSTFPGSEKEDEASFNALNLQMNAYRDLLVKFDSLDHSFMLWNFEDARIELVKINQEAASMSELFVARFPRSYLADDALFYRLRIAAAIDDEQEVWTIFCRLVQEYPRSDMVRRSQYEIESFLRDVKQLGSEASHLRDEVLRRASRIGDPLPGPGAALPGIDSRAAPRLARRFVQAEGPQQGDSLARSVVVSWLQWRMQER